MKTLNKSVQEFSFYKRERENGKVVGNKCGRDFLYYALNFYFPAEFNNTKINPKEIDRLALFGNSTPPFFAWSQIQFASVANFLNRRHFKLFINEKEVKGYFSFVASILFTKKEFETAMKYVENAVDRNEVVGIDISLGMFGLLDHVLFVYGYDNDNLFVFDTHKVSKLGYVSMDDSEFYYRLPKDIIQSHWTTFGRVWSLKKF